MRSRKWASLQTCSISRGSFLGSKTVTVSPCWKIFSTVFANSLYYQRAISNGSTFVGGANSRPCCALRGPVSTWAFDGTAWTKIVPPVGFPKENPSTSIHRRQARPGRKTGDIPPDRMEMRPESRGPECRSPGGPEPRGQAEAGG